MLVGGEPYAAGGLHAAVGRVAEARAGATSLREQQPNVSVASLIDDMKGVPFKDLSFLERHSQLLRAVGLPELRPC